MTPLSGNRASGFPGGKNNGKRLRGPSLRMHPFLSLMKPPRPWIANPKKKFRKPWQICWSTERHSSLLTACPRSKKLPEYWYFPRGELLEQGAMKGCFKTTWCIENCTKPNFSRINRSLRHYLYQKQTEPPDPPPGEAVREDFFCRLASCYWLRTGSGPHLKGPYCQCPKILGRARP